MSREVRPRHPGRATILVVDDTPENLALMSGLLADTYKVKIANGGAKALQIAISEAPPDLILLDIMMPDMDGYEVCQRLKLNPTTEDIPVIFLTAMVEAEDERKGLELGAVDYISKPISPAIVLARVKNHLALKAMADILKEQNIALEQARAVAEKANQAKSEFLSSMSHELRSPLNAILGFAQLMETDSVPPTPSQGESIAQILGAGWHLLTLINEILDLATVESGQVPMVMEPLSVNDVLVECWGMVQPQAQKRGITMSFPPEGASRFVLGDRTRVKQVLVNLLSNAIKYNRPAGEVSVECLQTPSGTTVLSVQDTGRGLSEEQLAQLFQPFNRLGQECSAVEGTGIGLVVAKRLVERMGGQIGVSSTPGVGSRFWFGLQAVADPDPGPPCAPVEAPGEPGTARGTYPRSLLYIEDNPANVKLVEQIIARRPDLILLTAGNAGLGIEIACDHQPEVILMDINLSGMTGLQAMKNLQDNPATAHIPVLAISANTMPRDIKRGLEAGFFGYLTKPIRVQAFLEALELALGVTARDLHLKSTNLRFP